jgi:hypothetical protein
MEQVTDPEQGKLRKAASDGAQASIWIWFLAMLALLIVLAVGWGLSHRVSPHAPDMQPELPTLPGKQPELPTLPGKTPEPQNP